MNFDQARFNMIEQQIRPWYVLDQGILDLIAEIHREDFVPENYRTLAFADLTIPLGHGEVMMTPKVEARLLQALAIDPDDEVLEIGTGSTYLTSLLANLGGHVYSVDIYPDFTTAAAPKLNRYRITNVTLERGDAVSGWKKAAPYDVIVATGSVPVLSEDFQEQLKPGGRLFVIVGESPVMEATLITRVGKGEWASESLFETDIPPLVGALRPRPFKL
ncbi:MAG: protein-L-isoaspartate O-methyltransferase [Gammaproteobacteria bacterium]|nr:protein-L-isoaspartate O-methyltransferase [Gammaproteobacteria bacterium]